MLVNTTTNTMPKKQKEETLTEGETEKKVVKPRAKKTKETVPIPKETVPIPKETVPIPKETEKQTVAIVENQMNEKKEQDGKEQDGKEQDGKEKHKLPISKSITNKALSASDFLQKWGYNGTVKDIVFPKHYDFVQKIVALENMKKKK
jgi:hypothetical protein